jgi:P27 family predicted phage terminase small subunit
MGAGRKPTPIELRILRGNPGCRRIPDDLPRPKSDRPACPKRLKGEARAEWKRITAEFFALGVLAKVDRAALVVYCLAWARLWEAEDHLDREGSVIAMGDNGYQAPSPWQAIKNAERATVRAFLIEFGGTPSSRVKVRVEKPTTVPTLAEQLKDAADAK